MGNVAFFLGVDTTDVIHALKEHQQTEAVLTRNHQDEEFEFVYTWDEHQEEPLLQYLEARREATGILKVDWEPRLSVVSRWGHKLDASYALSEADFPVSVKLESTQVAPQTTGRLRRLVRSGSALTLLTTGRPTVGDTVTILDTGNTRGHMPDAIGRSRVITVDTHDYRPYKVPDSDVWLYEGDVELSAVAPQAPQAEDEVEVLHDFDVDLVAHVLRRSN